MIRTLKVHPDDNIIVALDHLSAGESVAGPEGEIILQEAIPAKHKFSERDFNPGDTILMYGVVVGRATRPIPKGSRISRENTTHQASDFRRSAPVLDWIRPSVEPFAGRTFRGYHRADGRVGTRNYWLVFPLVFCENRNVQVIRDAMLEQLGYGTRRDFAVDIRPLILQYQGGASVEAILQTDILRSGRNAAEHRLFPNVDGIKFLDHEGGCGGIRQDAEALCQLLAGYVTHPNVAGATVLSLGCQNAQYSLLEAAIRARDPHFSKPLYVLEQQQSSSEEAFIADAVRKTFAGLMQANAVTRRPASLDKLIIGLECGGSDGFSGISANPVLGHVSDMIAVLGGTAILSEFPELNGVEQNLIDRCVDDAEAEKFIHLMRAYSRRAEEVGSGFDMNPSPGNIKDGLITDAMKSAGAAKKGGTSPVTGVLDYTEPATRPGLHLLCTPGNDVESTTGLAGSWANIILFTTGLGTPTGNPVAPTVKVSSNTILARRMPDLIDLDAGTVISGEDTIASKGEELLDLIIRIADGEVLTKAELLHQDDFIPWKRGISL